MAIASSVSDVSSPGSAYFYAAGAGCYSNHAECRSHYIRQETIMNAVKNLLDGLVRICVDVEELVSSVERMPKVVQYQKGARERLAGIRAKRMNQEAKLEQLLIDLTEGLIDRDEYDFVKARCLRHCPLWVQERATEEYDSYRR